MQDAIHYPDSVFCWVELSTTDAKAAKAFYSGLFGWDFDDRPTEMGGVYSMAKLGGKDVAGLGEMPQVMQEKKIPPFWMSYVKHDDADGVAARIEERGGKFILPPMDVMDYGRMIVAIDPTGASFGVWQPSKHLGAQVVNAPNSLIWNELQTRDLEGAKGFYAGVFDWTYQEDDKGYVVAMAGERVQAGMMKIQPEWGEVPPNWGVYFMVEDVNASAAKVQELGGNVMVPSTPAGDMGTFAVMQDPLGAVFSVMEFNGPVDPPPGA